jgi:3-dehydroquinate dehydratase/shikimate dehydrogenase
MQSRSLVIQVVAAETTEAMSRAYLAADARADLVELRLDMVRDLDLDRILRARGKPKLITVRSRQQGGASRPSEREPLLRRALEAGVEYVDLEFGSQDLPLLHGRWRSRIILSYHNLESTPADLQAVRARMAEVTGGAILKIVTFADASTDNLRIRDLLGSSDPGSLIAFCMGPKGIPSRILGPFWGSAAMFAPVRGAAPTAPGQVALEDLFDLYRFDRIGPETRLLGVLGAPVGHSLSPVMQNVALSEKKLDYRYIPFETTNLAEFLPLMAELPISGLSVTLPHKEKILSYLDEVDPIARSVGAVNTVVKSWNRLKGFNTDVEAALSPLRKVMSLQGARVALLGAGGAARALLFGLTRAGARVTVFNRTGARARALAREIGARHLPWSRLKGFACDLLINATSVGLAPDTEDSPLPASWVKASRVYDIVYNPPETLLLRQARKRGAAVHGGVDMFVEQGAVQFRLFTGVEPPVTLMRRAVLDALGPAASARSKLSGRRTGRAAGRGGGRKSGPKRSPTPPRTRRR